jgi:hypothetical protein
VGVRTRTNHLQGGRAFPLEARGVATLFLRGFSSLLATETLLKPKPTQ